MGNELDAAVCSHCGTSLKNDLAGVPTTQRVERSFELTEEIKDQITKGHTPPSQGLSLFLLSRVEPIALCIHEEFVLGRGGISASEPMVDLTKFDAFAIGVSRRHAMIRATGDKYVLIDLNSSNGTWLNGLRLTPSKPYDLPNSAVIQLGRMALLVVYVKPVRPKTAKQVPTQKGHK